MRVGSLEIEIMAGMARLQKDMNEAQRIVGGSMSNVERSVASAKRAMQALGVGLPLAAITDQVRRMTDQYTKLDAQLRLATKSQSEYAQGMADIRRISTVAQADISATSMLYTRLMNVMQGTGVEQSKLATVTETVAYGLKAYGATAQEASSAALQLSQAMGANRLGGEEFRAVMEAMPNVMKVVADSMGVPLGALRQLSIDGKITADVLVKALGDPAIAAQFKLMAERTQTITGAWVVARNELTLLVGEFMKSSGATGGFIGAFNVLADSFKLMAQYMQQLISLATIMAALYGGRYVVAMRAAWAVTQAHTEALVMNAAGNKAHAAVVAQTSNAAAAAKLKETIAAREALFATEAELVGKAASARATIAQTESTLANTNMFVLNTAAKQANTVATAELVVVEAALAKINKARTAAQVEATAMDVARTRELTAQTVATAAATAAEEARAAATLSTWGKLRAFAVSNAFGLAGLALWGAYEIADHLGWIDKVFSSADARIKKLREDILDAREIASQKKSTQPSAAAGFALVPGLVEDTAKAYLQAVGDVKEFRAYMQSDSFVFSKDFLSREQEKAAKAAKIMSDYYAEMDKLQKTANLSDKARTEAAMTLHATKVERLAELEKKSKKEVDVLAAQLADIEKARLYAAFDDDKAARIAHSQFLLTLELSTSRDKFLAEKEANQAAFDDAFRKQQDISAAEAERDAERQAAIAAETKWWSDMFKKVDDFAHDAFLSIFDKGKNAFEQIGEVIKKSVLELLYSMTVRKWILQVGVAGGGTMAAGAANAAGTTPEGVGIIKALKDGFGDMSAGFTSLAGEVSGGLQSLGVAPGTAGSVGIAAAYASAAIAGIGIGKMIAGDKELMGMSGQKSSAIGAAIGAAAAGPIGAVIGGALGGLANRAFGLGPKVSGTTMLQGQFGAGGFAGQYATPWTQKGGFLRSNRSGMDVAGLGGAQAGLSGMVGSTAAIFAGLAGVSGTAARSLEGWTFAINRQVATQEQQKQLAIDLADSMGKHVLPMLESFRQAGESLADTALRLTTEVVALNQFYSQLGVTTRATIQDADQLATALGGITNAAQLMNSFVKSFAPNTQVIENSLNTLASAGLTQAEFFTTTEQWWVFMQSASLEQKAAMLANQGAIQDYIGAMDKSRTAIGATVQALKDQSIAAYEAARSMVDGLRQFAASVRDLQRSLWLGAQSPVADKAALTRAEFLSVNAAAAGGDTVAQGRLSSAATAYLDAAKLQATSSIAYAQDFAFVQNALSETALTTDNMVTTAERQLAELVQANVWLSSLDEKNRLQNHSLQYLLTASTEASNAARQAVITQAIADAMDSIARAVISAGGTFNASGVMQTAGTGGGTDLSYASGYTTYKASVGATGAVSSVGAVVDPVAKAAADAAALAQRVAAKQAALDAYNAAKAIYDAKKAESDAVDLNVLRYAVYQTAAYYTNVQQPLQAAEDAAYADMIAKQSTYQTLPSFAVGSNEIPSDMIAQVHRGEKITPKPFVDLDKAAREETNALLREMKKELTLIKGTNYRLWLIEDERNANGMPEVREAA